MIERKIDKELLQIQSELKLFALKLTNNSNDALDLIQDTYVKAFFNRDKFINYKNIKWAIFRIMKNVFYNNYRKNKKHFQIDENQNINNIKKPCEELFSSPEINYTIIEIEHSINSLNEVLRISFKMYIEGYKYREIADILKIKEVTVRSRIFRARQKLRIVFKDYFI